jgi:hypothetical protein
MTNNKEINNSLPIEQQLDEMITRLKHNNEIIQNIGQEVSEVDKSGRLTTSLKKLKTST